MIIDFAQSQTRLNLMKAFAGESQARERYSIAASFAKNRGMFIIANLFLTIADQEKEHGEIFYEFLKPFSGENIKFSADYPVDLFDSVLDFLRKASRNELEEYDDVYKKFGEIAASEGFPDISQKFVEIARIEKTHHNKFKQFAYLIESNELFSSKNGPSKWICLNCGNVYEGSNVPEVCPVCNHPRGYFLKSGLSF